MPLFIWLAAAGIALAIPLFLVSVATPKAGKRARDTLTASSTLSFRDVSLARPARDRFADGILYRFQGAVRRFTPAGISTEADRRIGRAGVGNRWTAERLLTVKALLAVAVFAVLFIVAIGAGSTAYLVMAVVLAAVAFVIPDFILIRRGDERQRIMRDELPDVIDQVVISVEAGLSFDGAVDRISRNSNGPLEQELQRVMQDIALGLSRKDALLALSDRSDVPELRELVLALAQSEEHGLPVGRVLRVQADEIRDKRKARAEERAMQVPVKIVFPLILCILPCLAIVIIGPAIVRISENLSYL